MAAGNILTKLKFDSHHKIERFTVEFISLFMVLVICAGVSLVYKVQGDRTTLDTTAVYTMKFSTSKSNASGKVVGVYKSNDGKSSLLMLKFDDNSLVSSDAMNYRLFLTSANVSGNPKGVGYNPAGSIYMFGTTGYMGIYLYNESGFIPQVLDLVVRCSSELINKQESDVKLKDGEDESFSRYDQFRVYFNPGASDAVTINSLSGDDVDLSKIYEETVITPQEEEIKATLDDDVNKMRVALNTIKEYRDQLQGTATKAPLYIGDNVSVVVPEDPYYIAGDEVIADVGEDGKKTGTYTYKAATVIQGGVDFNYKSSSVSDGYFKLVTDDKAHSAWLMNLPLKAKENDEHKFTTSMDWYLSDGTLWQSTNSQYNSPLNTGTTGSDKSITAVNTAIKGLETAWSNYYNLKSTYQQDDLVKLLKLELEVENIKINNSVNNSDNVVTVY